MIDKYRPEPTSNSSRKLAIDERSAVKWPKRDEVETEALAQDLGGSAEWDPECICSGHCNVSEYFHTLVDGC